MKLLFFVQGPDGENIKLPSFETTPTKPPSPTKVKFSEGVESSKPISIITRGNENDGGGGGDNDSESSDWSSSASDGEGGEEREGGEGGGGGGGGGGGMKPSHHTNLIAEWEWRTMADTTDTRYVHMYNVMHVYTSSSQTFPCEISISGQSQL